MVKIATLQDSSLIKNLMQKLTAEDIIQLKTFLKSRNVKDSVLNFYNELTKYYPEFNHRNCTNQKVYKKVFKGLAYKEKTLSNLKTDLRKQIEAYFIDSEIQESEKLIFLAKAYKRRNINRSFFDISNKSIKVIEKQSSSLEEKYYQLMMVNFEMYNINELKTNFKYVKNAMEMLDQHYHFLKAKYSIRIINEQNVLDYKYEIRLLDEVIKIGNNTMFKDHPLFELYVLTIKLLKDKNQKAFDELYQRATSTVPSEDLNMVSKIDLNITLRLLTNIAIKIKSNTMETKVKTIFNINKYRMTYNLFEIYNQISNTDFINVILIAARNKEYHWAENFIKKYSNLLNEGNKEDVLIISSASLLYNQGKFDEATELLQHCSSKDPHYEIRFKSLYLRSFYEIFTKDNSYQSMLSSKINEFDTFVKKHLKSTRKVAYHNFCLKCNWLVKNYGELKISAKKKSQFIKSLEKMDSQKLHFKDWLLEKVNII